MDFSGNRIGDNSMKAFAKTVKEEGYPKLKHLILDSIFIFIIIYLGCGLSSECGKPLNDCLHLSWNGLITLSVEGNEIGDKGIIEMESGFVESCNTLESLNLSSIIIIIIIFIIENGITSISCISLGNIIKSNNCIVNLNLSQNIIGNEGFKRICEGLNNCSYLKILNLDSILFLYLYNII